MDDNKKIAVIGGGSWATAIVKMLVENEEKVGWYMRNVYALEHIKINHHNPNYLSSVEFDVNKLDLSNNLNDIVDNYDYLIFAIPSAFLKQELDAFKPQLREKIIFSAIKGIVPETGTIVGEFFHNQYSIPYDRIGVVTGPCHAEEVALERLSYLTIACQNSEHAEIVADKISCEYIRTKISDDIYGTEYSAVLKNIYSIAAGVAHGLGYGDNFQAVLMSNSIREIGRFLEVVYPIQRDINNLAYLGDLLVTGYSVFSRNRMFGNMIGKGYTVKSAQMEMNMVAEGYYASKSITKLVSKYDIDMPITEAIYKILYKGKEPKQVMSKLTEKLN
ncbi:MAG: NAD(P)H-dependent glycerol-3-phosphate dehydrogenase [Bacteroidota bacterium]